MSHRDPVSPDLRWDVFRRDARETGMTVGSPVPLCVAPLLGATDRCAGPTQLDHIQDGYGRMGRRAPSDLAHLVAVCRRHHIDTGWATSHRSDLRAYLERVNPA